MHSFQKNYFRKCSRKLQNKSKTKRRTMWDLRKYRTYPTMQLNSMILAKHHLQKSQFISELQQIVKIKSSITKWYDEEGTHPSTNMGKVWQLENPGKSYILN